MPSPIAKLFIVPAAAAVLLIGAPVFAQSQPPSSSDPFSDVPAVGSDEMSAVSGELAGGISDGISMHIGTDNRGAGTQRGGGVPSNAVGTTTRNVSASGSQDFANQGYATVTITTNNYGGNGGLSQ